MSKNHHSNKPLVRRKKDTLSYRGGAGCPDPNGQRRSLQKKNPNSKLLCTGRKRGACTGVVSGVPSQEKNNLEIDHFLQA